MTKPAYFDEHRGVKAMLPRVPGDGVVLIVYGLKATHKTGVVVKECLDAIFNKNAAALYVAADGAHGLKTRRLPRAMSHRGKDLAELNDNWTTLNAKPNILSDQDRHDLLDWCKYFHFAPQIVVFDTLSKCIGGARINDPETGSGIINAMEDIARGFGGATVIGITHPGIIGSAQLNLAFGVWRVSFDSPSDIISVYVEYMKDGPAEFVNYMRKVATDGGVPVVGDVPPDWDDDEP